MQNNREESLMHLAASLKEAKKTGEGAILLVGAGISVSAGIPPAFKLMKLAVKEFPDFFNAKEKLLLKNQSDLTDDELKEVSQLQYNKLMGKLSNIKRKELFSWFIKGNTEKDIPQAKLNFAHIAIAELLKQGYFSRILTVNFDPLLIHACYMVGMYPFPAIYDLGAMGRVNAELLHDPSIVYLNGQHIGFVQRNTDGQLKAHEETLKQIVRSTGCKKPWVVAGYSGENDPLMKALSELRPYNDWLYWLNRNNTLRKDEKGNTISSHQFLEKDEECKVIHECDADETFMGISELLECNLDFIERPEIELKRYLKEISFDMKSKRVGHYREKIERYINILEDERNREAFDKIDMAEKLYTQGWDNINKSNDEELSSNEKITLLDKAEESFNESYELHPQNFQILLSYSSLYLRYVHYMNTHEEKQEYLEKAFEFIDKASQQTNTHDDTKLLASILINYNTACYYSLKGDTRSALNSLKKSVNENQQVSYLNENIILNDIDLHSIKDHPEFTTIISQIGAI